MPVITNVGGSITSAVALTLLAWAVRFIRSRAERQRRRQKRSGTAGRSGGLYSSALSPAALRMLVHPKAFPSNLLACVTKVAQLLVLSKLGCRLRVLGVPCAFALSQTCQHPHRTKLRLLAPQPKPRCRWRQIQCRTVWWTCAAPKLRNRHPCQRTCRLHSTFQVRNHTLCQTVKPKHMEPTLCVRS